MTTVEFRLLQYIISHVGGDRITVALLHWDGAQLRVAHSLAGLAICDAGQRDVVRKTVEVLVTRAEELAEQMETAPRLNTGLADLFPVREGLGGALFWTPVVEIETADAEAHFAELGSSLRLGGEENRTPRPFSSARLGRQLVGVGRELLATAPNSVRVEATIHNVKEYRSPLSWKNAAWHHAVPFSLEGMDETSITREVERLYGLTQLAIPEEDVPVLVIALPSNDELSKRMEKEAKVVQGAREHCLVIPTPVKARRADLTILRSHIERDLAHTRKASK
jgi:hypothetical protein